MRTEYVTPLLGQMDSRIERLRLQQNEAETAEAKLIGKEIDSLTKQLTELRSFGDQLKHYADMRSSSISTMVLRSITASSVLY